MREQTFHGGCHCGAVRYSAELNFNKGSIRCNCSFCSKSRAWFAFTPDAKFQLNTGQEKLTTYRWTPAGKAKPTLSYHSCSECGVRTHAKGVGPDGSPIVAVQVATIEDADPEDLAKSINYVDGLHDRFDRRPADTRLL